MQEASDAHSKTADSDTVSTYQVLFSTYQVIIIMILFAICAYLNEYVTSASYPHVNIANPIKINIITTLYLKSIINTYCELSKWCMVSRFPSHLQDLI